MKNKYILMIMIIMACALCACGKQPISTTNNTENSTKQIVTNESNTEQKVTETTEQPQIKEASYSELGSVLDEINTNVHPETAGNGLVSIKVAAHLLNWGVGTSMSTDEIKKETIKWLSDKGNTEQVDFSNKLASVYDAYQRLLGTNAKELLEEAGCEDAAYPWSDSPVETIEAIIDVVQLPEDTTESSGSSVENNEVDNSSSEYPDPEVAELVNLRGDKTTVYLLADGRYMDRTEEVYTYDGIDTWTDESGVEWNEAVK
jgi:hypothetical protein